LLCHSIDTILVHRVQPVDCLDLWLGWRAIPQLAELSENQYSKMKRTTSLIQRAGMLILPAGLSLFSAVPPQLSAQNVMTIAGLPGVPITQEPHHRLVFQNSFVKEVRVV